MINISDAFSAYGLVFSIFLGQAMGQSLNLFGACRQVQLMLMDNANLSQVASTSGSPAQANANCGSSACSSTGVSFISSAKSGWDFVSRFLMYPCLTSSLCCLIALMFFHFFLQKNTVGAYSVIGGATTYYLNSYTALTPLYSGSTPVVLPFLVEVRQNEGGWASNAINEGGSLPLYHFLVHASLFAAVVIRRLCPFCNAAVDSNCFAHITGCHPPIGLHYVIYLSSFAP